MKDGFPPILLAAINNHEDILSALIEGGADVNAGNEEQLTALHISAKYGLLCILKKLLLSNADLRKATKVNEILS